MADLKERKTIRLKNYDYSQNGRYFITVLTKNHENILSDVIDDEQGYAHFKLSELGKLVQKEILNICFVHSFIKIPNYIIMPNHVHMIIELNLNEKEAMLKTATISSIINQWKGSISRKAGFSIWHKSFHDHIIRDNYEYEKITRYIDNNPKTWLQDCYYPYK
jgi:REP element-mobilizing transposase RayT